MLRDERLQKVVSDIDSAPDRERVREGVVMLPCLFCSSIWQMDGKQAGLVETC